MLGGFEFLNRPWPKRFPPPIFIHLRFESGLIYFWRLAISVPVLTSMECREGNRGLFFELAFIDIPDSSAPALSEKQKTKEKKGAEVIGE